MQLPEEYHHAHKNNGDGAEFLCGQFFFEGKEGQYGHKEVAQGFDSAQFLEFHALAHCKYVAQHDKAHKYIATDYPGIQVFTGDGTVLCHCALF